MVTKVNIQSFTPPILNPLLCWFQNSFFLWLYLQNWVGAALLKILSQVSHVWFSNMDLIISHKKGFNRVLKGAKCLKLILWVYIWHYDHISTNSNNLRSFWSYIHRGLIWFRNSCAVAANVSICRTPLPP